MTNLPSEEFWDKIIFEKYDRHESWMWVYSKYNAEIIRLNTPQKPEFPSWVKYITFDLSDGWWYWINKPTFRESKYWYTTEEDFDLIPAFAITSNEILWLEYINANRPPEQSLIKLEEYK